MESPQKTTEFSIPCPAPEDQKVLNIINMTFTCCRILRYKHESSKEASAPATSEMWSGRPAASRNNRSGTELQCHQSLQLNDRWIEFHAAAGWITRCPEQQQQSLRSGT